MSQIENFLQEHRRFAAPDEFKRRALLSSEAEYERMSAEALADPEGFWGRAAGALPWIERWGRVLDWSNAPVAKWFVGGKLNASAVCVDQHATGARAEKPAIVWEGEPGDRRTLSYAELHAAVQRLANGLKARGVERGDRVAIYMPLVPEAAIAMLACARIGAAHSVVFGGFSAAALKDRIEDGDCTVVITADGGWRRGKEIELKSAVDASLEKSPSVEKVVVVRRTGSPVRMEPGRDYWWHDLMADASPDCDAVEVDSEHPLYILYTSGSTGKPKGMLHTTAGYLLGTMMTSKWVFDLKDEDTYWCTADIGWVTGHSYVVYGLLANGATTLMYEGAPNWPHPGRFWEIIEKYKVNIFYTAPTAIRSFMRWGEEHPQKFDLSKLRLLGSVGEPINPEAWMWYRRVIGGERCPIVDTWWQTETGGIMITPLPGVTVTKPGSATRPFFGIDAAIFDEEGNELGPNQGGLLVIRKPWPGMLRGIWGDPERFRETYWSRFPGVYLAGDGARKDADGYFWILGRVDDVINVAGHRLSTMEVESALVSHPLVVEAAVVARPDELTGQAISAFVTLGPGHLSSAELALALGEHVTKEIGKLARPAEFHFTDALPKTRSGKIMRRLLRDVAAGVETVGDTSTIEDYSVLAKLRNYEE